MRHLNVRCPIMTLNEFMNIYRYQGSVYAILVIDELTDCDLITFIGECPELSRYLPCSGNDWVHMVCTNTKYAIHCDWNKLDGSDWCYLLSNQPKFHTHCDWYKLTGDNWYYLLRIQSQLYIHCDWDKLSGSAWSYLLRNQPKFHIHCDWDKLTGDDWKRLLRNTSEFEKFKLNAT